MNLPKKLPNVDLIVLMKFGSHLYGTNDENSDTDYKGVYMPSKEDMFLGNNLLKPINIKTQNNKIEGVKNTKEDVDIELFSLQRFIKLACEGQTVALDMLHAPNNMLLTTSSIWGNITSQKHLFYTKNLQAFVDYANKQAAKYGIKGSRIEVAEKVMYIIQRSVFETYNVNFPIALDLIWDKLPITEYSYFIKDSPNGTKQYHINGKTLQSTMKLKYAYDIIKKYYDKYGERARQAKENKGVDWKAVSHALRAGYQVIELFEDHTITFPLKKNTIVKGVKNGKYDYTTIVAPELEHILEECKRLSEKSSFPEETNVRFWEKFIVKTCNEFITVY